MISIDNSTYLLPTKSFRKLAILLAIHNKPDSSQHKIAQNTNLSSAMVNSYIRDLATQGFIKLSNKNNRDLNYLLTRSGKKALLDHWATYSAEIVQLYTQAKNEISARLTEMINGSSRSRIVLFGASETCEMVLRALENFPQVSIAAIVDSSPAKQEGFFHGHKVCSPDEIETLLPDFIIITSFARQNEIYRSIQHLEKKGIRIKKLAVK